MNLLPKYEQAVIPIQKFTHYALDPEGDMHKALVFKSALGYDKENAMDLIENIRAHLPYTEAELQSDLGFGKRYKLTMTLTGPNGKSAEVVTAWIDDKATGQMRLSTVYILKKKGRLPHD